MCSQERVEQLPVKYFIMIGNGRDIANCVKAFGFGRLEHDQINFIVYLEIVSDAQEQVEVVL